MKQLAKNAIRFVKSNGSTICSIFAVVGLGVSAACLIDETTEANKLLEDKEDKSLIEKAKIIIPAYKKSIASVVVTGALILGSNVISKKQQASLMATYAVLGDQYRSYRKTVKEELGEEKELELLKQSLEKYIPHGLEEGKELYYDDYSGRFFESTENNVVKAELIMNRSLCHMDGCCLNDVYNELDIKEIPDGDIVGWSWPGCVDGGFDYFPEIIKKKIPAKDGKPGYTILYFSIEPSVEHLNWELWNDFTDAQLYLESLNNPQIKRVLDASYFDYDSAKTQYEDDETLRNSKEKELQKMLAELENSHKSQPL